MKQVRAKKYLGQHFLNDLNVAQKITDSLSYQNYKTILEIGPGMGVLTQYLLKKDSEIYVIEIDKESVSYLRNHFSDLQNKIIEGDFLKLPLHQLFNDSFALIGNFPYNISSQILFKTLENKELIPEVVGMFQKEVAERIAAKAGNKTYGILSVLIQAFYEVEYLFTVNEDVFTPPPKVKSAVIRLTRKKKLEIDCDEKMFRLVVKTAFNQRRKTLRNALKSIPLKDEQKVKPYLSLRAEQLSVDDFIQLTQSFES